MKNIKSEATKEGESTVEEQSEYDHIDSFLSELDEDELAYVKKCISEKKGKMEKSGDSESNENATSAEKEVSEKDFED